MTRRKTIPTNAQRLNNKARFLAAYSITGSISAAAAAAQVPRSHHYAWLEANPSYREKFEAANRLAAELVDAEVMRRALFGLEEPVIHEGRLCFRRDKDDKLILDENGNPIPLTVNKRSDTILIFAAKATNPKKYREHFNHTVDGAINVMNLAQEIIDGAKAAEES